MLSRAQNSFHHTLSISYTRAGAGPFLVYYYIYDDALVVNIRKRHIC